MANEMRNKLINLLHTIEDHPEKTCPRKESDSCDGCEFNTTKGNGCDTIARRADYLIKNGVIAPPCKVGTTLYFLYNSPHANKPDLTYRIYESNEWYFHIDENGTSIQTKWVRGCDGEYHYYLDKNVFLTKEAAEQKLKEMRGE